MAMTSSSGPAALLADQAHDNTSRLPPVIDTSTNAPLDSPGTGLKTATNATLVAASDSDLPVRTNTSGSEQVWKSHVPSSKDSQSNGVLSAVRVSSQGDSQTSLTTANDGQTSCVVPQIDIETPSTATASPTPKDSQPKWLSLNNTEYTGNSPKNSPSASSFKGINLDLSDTGLSEEIGTGSMRFSNRGSMLVDGRRINQRVNGGVVSAKTMPIIQEPKHQVDKAAITRKRAATAISERLQARVMSTDEEQLSEKVRSFYSFGTDATTETDQTSISEKRQQRWKDSMRLDTDSALSISRRTSATDTSKTPQTPTISREDGELAGGVEDWRDIGNAEVDRYGFIIPKSPVSDTDRSSKHGSLKRTPTLQGQGLQRVSTALQLASETPRRKHTVRRSPSKAQSAKSGKCLNRRPSAQSLRPSSSKSLGASNNRSIMHNFANKFSHYKDRRAMDEAGDFLTFPGTSENSLSHVLSEDSNSTNVAFAPPPDPISRHKEAERDEKWRKMAQLVPRPTDRPQAVGGGQQYHFPETSKLIERTWKGIPDSWRATAWHAFLSESASRHNQRHPKSPCLPDETLHEIFHAYQDKGSPDDVQIDIDVPRTISSHIMFRRRYRGGQRLLFRVLHAMSLHFSTTGYVQGMASIAATLLAYYSEEDAFVMLVRMWELRGLEKLYKDGFGGLMEGLEDFERDWLGVGDVGQKLNDLGITGTAYGTKWYLTLFGYSIPFGCVLRVWDVFMLLGGEDHDQHQVSTNGVTEKEASINAVANDKQTVSKTPDRADEKANFGTTLDILHATSAALIDGMRDILVDSDFETAMKVLTSWVPIRDEDLFMRVARAEWKVHRERKKK